MTSGHASGFVVGGVQRQRGLACVPGGPLDGSMVSAVRGAWPDRCPPDIHRDQGPAEFLGSGGARHFSGTTGAGRRLTGLDERPHMFLGQLGDVRQGVLFGHAVGRDIHKVGNARDEAAFAVAIDHRPIPDFVHFPLLPIPRGTVAKRPHARQPALWTVAPCHSDATAAAERARRHVKQQHKGRRR